MRGLDSHPTQCVNASIGHTHNVGKHCINNSSVEVGTGRPQEGHKALAQAQEGHRKATGHTHWHWHKHRKDTRRAHERHTSSSEESLWLSDFGSIANVRL